MATGTRTILWALLFHGFASALIDRQNVVSQFNIVRKSLINNETTPLQVGNGNFAFNVDSTGMQVRNEDSISSQKLIKQADIPTFQYIVKLGMA